MIRLKLNLPEETIEYNAYGILTSGPAPYAPENIKNLGIRCQITGYVDGDVMFAFKLESRDKQFAVGEQLTLLRALGFKVVPFIMDERTAGDSLISIKERFKQYDPQWVYANSGKILSTPEIVSIIDCKWDIVNKGLTLQVTTDKGVFPIVDMRYIEYFQPHGKAKLVDDCIQPYMTTPVSVPIPEKCPKCNNPLKRLQPYPDLPLFFRCTSKFCTQMVLDEPKPDVQLEEEVDVNEDSFRVQAESKDIEQPVSEESVLDAIVTVDTPVEFSDTVESEGTGEIMEEEPTTATAHGESSVTTTQALTCLVDSNCDADTVQRLIDAGKIEVTQDTDNAAFILVKSRRSVTRAMRDIAKDWNLEFRPISDFE